MDKKKINLFALTAHEFKTPPMEWGLGLYITKEIIEHLEGKIWIKSKLDRGSMF